LSGDSIYISSATLKNGNGTKKASSQEGHIDHVNVIDCGANDVDEGVNEVDEVV
jgi:hypothetical protein